MAGVWSSKPSRGGKIWPNLLTWPAFDLIKLTRNKYGSITGLRICTNGSHGLRFLSAWTIKTNKWTSHGIWTMPSTQCPFCTQLSYKTNLVHSNFGNSQCWKTPAQWWYWWLAASVGKPEKSTQKFTECEKIHGVKILRFLSPRVFTESWPSQLSFHQVLLVSSLLTKSSGFVWTNKFQI